MKILIFSVLVLWGVTRPASAADLTLSSMINAIQSALLEAAETVEDNNLNVTLKEVFVELNTTNTTEAGAKGGWLIFKASATRKDVATSKLTMTLIPPQAGADLDVSPATEEIRDILAAAIAEGSAAYGAAKGGNPPLEASQYVIELKFAVTQSANGELSLALPPLDVGANGSISQQAIQTIKITFD